MTLATSAVLISLPSRADRRATVLERWQATGATLPLRVFDAIDGTKLTLPPGWASAGAEAYGCYLSHMRALERATGPTLILEDDAEFLDGFLEMLELEPPSTPWDLLYMGGESPYYYPPQPPLQPSNGPVALTHAYIARTPRAIADILRPRQTRGATINEVYAMPIIRKVVTVPFVVRQDDSPAGAEPAE